ncbi:putative nad dependent epimerase [Diaporthe ampelina]|uniref:Putative nad dependent epimerase n=1 Tax=Diaporthe ampelina TaxID=1214573 RepID=A0A0G2FRD0_9PEZI|nr:putative nad dependent epimerase [Diaporthe ampelina]
MEEAIWSTTWGWRAFLIMDVIGRLKGLQGGLTICKIMLEYYQDITVGEIRRKAKERYRRHHGEVWAAAPEGRLLEYKVEDGWGGKSMWHVF